MAIQANFPAIKPSLNLDFSNTKKLDSRVTFTRSTTATYYDGVTTAKAEENLLLRSQEFDIVGVWPTQNATVTANTEVAPDGTTTAETLTDDAASNAHRIEQILTGFAAGTTYTASCFIKKGTNNFAALTVTDAATAQRYFAADFDLDSGVVRISGAGTSGTLTSSSIASVGNGWFRCVITGQVAVVGTTTMRLRIALSDGASAFTTFGGISYVGTGSTIYVWGAQLEQRSSVTSYTATTTQQITNYIPVLLTAANNQPRFDHNPTTDESLGLLIEEQRTNLVLQSDDFANVAWTKVTSTITANAIVAPDGTLTGDKLILNNTETVGYVSSNNSYTSGTSYTFSCYAKQGEQTDFRIITPTSAFGSSLNGIFNLSTGTVTSFTSSSASIQSVGNGWYRCSITATATSTSTGFMQLRSNFTGNGYSGIYIWGAQLEAGAFPTSYIATTSAAVTRSADAASMTGTNFSSWYNQSEGTVYMENSVLSLSKNAGMWAIGDSTLAFASRNSLYSLSSASTGVWFVSQSVNGVLQLNTTATTGSFVVGVSRKTAYAFQLNNSVGASNGAIGTTDTSCLVPATSNFSLTIGDLNAGWTNGANILNGHIRKLAYYPLRLTNAQLQALTG